VPVTLRPLTVDNMSDCYVLSISEEERQLSMLQEMPDMISEGIKDSSRVALTIYSNETMVGFADYSALEESGLYKIHNFLIDQNHRRRGYAEAALRLIIDELCQKPDCKAIMVRYMPFNTTGAIELYKKVGFIEDPELDDNNEQRAILSCE
jgi:diamine N-acetyltransferase